MQDKDRRIGVVGGGAYGTALAHHLAGNHLGVSLWAREEEIVRQINRHHRNPAYLGEIPLAPGIFASSDLKEVVPDRFVLVLAVPSQFLRGILRDVVPYLGEEAVLVNVAKGLESETGKLLSEIYEETLPRKWHSQIAYLSGPSFARELALGHPSAVALGSREEAVGTIVRETFQGEAFFLDWTPDVTGVVLGGAVKNVIAIACGIADGLGYGHSTRAMFMTRGLHEMIDLGTKLGAKPETFHGLSGVGDLIVTCMGELSRNKRVGIEIGKGRVLTEIQKKTASVAEGIETSRAVHNLSQKMGLKMPLCEKVYRILHEGEEARLLMTNP